MTFGMDGEPTAPQRILVYVKYSEYLTWTNKIAIKGKRPDGKGNHWLI